MADAMNFQVCLDVMKWRQPKREDFANGNYGEVMHKSMLAGGILFDDKGKFHHVPDFVNEKWPQIIEVMGNKPQSYKLRLTRFNPGWSAVFAPWGEDIATAKWLATGFAKPGAAVCHAALRGVVLS